MTTIVMEVIVSEAYIYLFMSVDEHPTLRRESSKVTIYPKEEYNQCMVIA